MWCHSIAPTFSTSLSHVVALYRLDVPKQLVSVLDPFVKPQSRGTEIYHVNDRNSPVAMPVPKLEAKAQVRVAKANCCAVDALCNVDKCVCMHALRLFSQLTRYAFAGHW